MSALFALGPLARTLRIPASLRTMSERPWVGILAVMLSAIAATLTSRLTSFGLADIGGALGVGVDERAWITTAFSTAQMLIGPIAPWIAFLFGIRRVLFWGGLVFGIAEVLLPFSSDFQVFIALQFIAGLGSGTFIPLTVAFVLRSLPRNLWVFGIGAYAMNLELSLNIAATLEGWHIDHGGWAWIFWQNAIIAIPMLICVALGVPREPIKYEMEGKGDYWGMAYAGVGFALIFAALDQADRLDWLNSGLIVGLMVAGTLLVVAFVVQELTTATPGIDLRFLLRRNVPELLLVLVFIRFLVLSSNLLIPQFLTQVSGHRPQQVGEALLWIALPQFAIAPVVALLARRIDARILLAIGTAAVLAASLLASRLTSSWVESDFVPALVLQAIGQTMALTSLIYFFAQHLTPTDILTFGAIVQTARLFGGEVATAVIQTFVRKSEQFHSNLIGQHVTAGDVDTLQRLDTYSHQLFAPFGTADPANLARSVGVLATTVRQQAYTLAYADGFLLASVVALAALLIILFLRPAPAAPSA
jgi:MFS transporter, DHA2 family, multidrug resistance protein